VHISSKHVQAHNYYVRFNSSSFVNWMQMSILVNPLQDALKSLT
jgi:hypothetical protein